MNPQVIPLLRKPPVQKMKRVAAYARVSVSNVAMLHSLEAQTEYYRTLITGHAGWQFAGIYADEGISGTRAERPEFQRMLADCRDGRIDGIITKSISRFARNTVTLLDAVRELKALNIDVFFEEQNLHTTGADGELILTILASYAQEESRSVSENCRWRIRHNFRQGIPVSVPMTGYRIRKGEFEIIPEEAEIIRTIFRLYLSGLGRNAIARRLNAAGIPAKEGGVWHDSVIDGILRNEKYCGDLHLQKGFTDDHLHKKYRANNGELPRYDVIDDHAAIISRNDFEAAQTRLQKQAEHQPCRQRKAHPLTGKVICELCGAHYQRKIVHGKAVWKCGTFLRLGRDACPAKQVPEAALPEDAKEIHVCADNRLKIIFNDGHAEERAWAYPSRSEGWSEEMRRQAAEYTRKRWNHAEESHNPPADEGSNLRQSDQHRRKVPGSGVRPRIYG